MPDYVSLLSKKSRFACKSEGASMLPLLYPGELVHYRKTEFKRLKVDDIILIKIGRLYATHRVILKKGTYLITKGDNAPLSDGRIYPQDILAKATHITRNNKIVSIRDIYTLQSMYYFTELLEVTRLFKKKGINFVILKGIPLHLYYEKSTPKRIYADCDLLIEKKDIDIAIDILNRLGYIKKKSSASFRHEKLKDKKTEETFCKYTEAGVIVLDVHYEIVFMMNQIGRLNALYPQSLIDLMTHDFLASKTYIVVNGGSFPILSEANCILYLGLHFFHHNCKGTFRLALMDAVIRKTKHRDHVFKEIIRLIRLYLLEGYVYASFTFLERLFKTPLPAWFLTSIQPQAMQLEYIRKNILSTNIYDDEMRIEGGVQRFKNLYYLSPQPLLLKYSVFLYPAVIYSISWSIVTKIRLVLFRKNMDE